MPDVSVIVPTHNRAAMLRRHLRALNTQTYPRRSTEWIVVCDGCQDDSAAVARELGSDQVVELEGRGAAAARNAGLNVARGRYVAFLDDDIIASPGWLAALVGDQETDKGQTLHMGYCPFAPEAIETYLDRRNAEWYELKLRPLSDPDHSWRFTDFFGGNFAADRQGLIGLGGFDERFSLFEDAELGLRALQAGWRIRFVPAARAEHHAHRNTRQYADQAFRSGRVDVLFSRIHPDAAASLRIGMRRPLPKRIGGAIWREMARHGSVAIKALEQSAELGERLNLKAALDLAYALLWDGQYWRGVAAA
jgi:glycosyltransferase involved in cell wall biosynthesis